jgi:hypothetical protein
MISKKLFRILNGVRIAYSKSKKDYGRIAKRTRDNAIVIFPPPPGVDLDRYRFHQLMHVALFRLRYTPMDQRDKTSRQLAEDIIKARIKHGNYVDRLHTVLGVLSTVPVETELERNEESVIRAMEFEMFGPPTRAETSVPKPQEISEAERPPDYKQWN